MFLNAICIYENDDKYQITIDNYIFKSAIAFSKCIKCITINNGMLILAQMSTINKIAYLLMTSKSDYVFLAADVFSTQLGVHTLVSQHQYIYTM